MTDFTTLTACGECCVGCSKKIEGSCPGCIEADGCVPEWAESGRCKVHACAREHGVQFCGLCKEFPCEKLPTMISWNPNIIDHLAALRDEYIKKQGAIMKEKPKILYHGSKSRFDIVKPQQAHGVCEAESKMGIYAVATKDEAIPFALPFRWYPDEPGGKLQFNTDGKNSYLHYGSIDPNGKGYIYVLPADSFELVNEWEWVSSVEVKPIDIIEISVKDYLNTITFSEEAKKIQEEIYGLSSH